MLGRGGVRSIHCKAGKFLRDKFFVVNRQDTKLNLYYASNNTIITIMCKLNHKMLENAHLQ